MPEWDELSKEDLIALCQQQWELIERQQEQIASLVAEVERLRRDPPSGVARAVPSFVKPNRPPKEKKERKKRASSFVRHREEPTQVVEHSPERCPDCGRALTGGWVHRVRQVIEIPVFRYEVIEHRLMGRHCGVCRKNHIAQADLRQEVVGRCRVGVRLMSLVATLKHSCRMTIRGIQKLLGSLYRLHLSLGEIVEILHAVARWGQGLCAQIREAVRGSPHVHGDETSWRENGQNHWLWSFSTPMLRLYQPDKSRGHQVAEGVLGERYRGILCSDFYGGYSYHLGLHQRCWVHFLRDLHALREAHPEDAEVVAWVKEVTDLYEGAKAFQSEDRRERVRARERFQESLYALAQPYLASERPERVLAQRISRFVQELFTFVEHPDVPPDNNAAERAIRPAVIYRKVSGGTRSPEGSTTAATLMTLIGTWNAQRINPMDACQKLLAGGSTGVVLSHQA